MRNSFQMSANRSPNCHCLLNSTRYCARYMLPKPIRLLWPIVGDQWLLCARQQPKYTLKSRKRPKFGPSPSIKVINEMPDAGFVCRCIFLENIWNLDALKCFANCATYSSNNNRWKSISQCEIRDQPIQYNSFVIPEKISYLLKRIHHPLTVPSELNKSRNCANSNPTTQSSTINFQQIWFQLKILYLFEQ